MKFNGKTIIVVIQHGRALCHLTDLSTTRILEKFPFGEGHRTATWVAPYRADYKDP